MMLPEYRVVDLPDVNVGEVLRYAKTESPNGLPLSECLREMNCTKGYVSFAESDIQRNGNRLLFDFGETESKDLMKSLGSSEKALVFAATLGLEPDRLIAKYSHLSPAKTVLFQALATERVEALCDCFCKERKRYYRKSGFLLKPRFSPGYGDLPLALQKGILQALDCNRLLGISLTESLLMMPSKSVTAIAGIDSE